MDVRLPPGFQIHWDAQNQCWDVYHGRVLIGYIMPIFTSMVRPNDIREAVSKMIEDYLKMPQKLTDSRLWC